MIEVYRYVEKSLEGRMKKERGIGVPSLLFNEKNISGEATP